MKRTRAPLLHVLPVLTLLALMNLSCGDRSRLLTVTIDAPSLQANRVELRGRQPVHVYLPPSYARSRHRYPVLYFLPGYDDPHWIFTGGAQQGFRLRDAMDRLISEGLVKESIVVIPSSATSMGGTFYAKSPILGNWQGYIVQDLVQYMDGHYRTIAEPPGRAITGTTAGASGALVIAMLYPDIFGAVYALDPVLLSPGALGTKGLCSPDEANEFLVLQETWEKLPAPRAGLARTIYLQAQLGSSADSDHLKAFFLTMAAAYSPDPDRRGLPIRLPYRRGAAGIIPDATAQEAFESGLGDWETKVARYGSNFRRLRLIAIDYGLDTAFPWHPKGCAHLDAVLTAAGIPHQAMTHRGNFDDRFRERMEGFLLPIVSKVLHAEEMP